MTRNRTSFEEKARAMLERNCLVNCMPPPPTLLFPSSPKRTNGPWLPLLVCRQRKRRRMSLQMIERRTPQEA
jgi:hypothetical protein